jgi:uncharacterized protein YecE (DUF72 family)
MSGPDGERREISVGCAELPAGMARRTYFQKLRFLEARLPSDQVPGERILRRWRTEAGGDGRFALVAPRELCDLHLPAADSGGHAALARRLAECAQVVHAAAVVFATPTQVTPSSTHRDSLKRFFDTIATADMFGAAVRVWQPDGLWRPPVAARVARELGVVPAQDPLAPDPLEEGGAPPPGEIAYVRVPGLGRANRPLGDDDLSRLAEWLEPCRRGFVVFDTPAKLRDAVGLSRWVGSSGAAAWN